MIGREIAKRIQQNKNGGKSENVIQLKYEDKVLDIKTINIQQLVKKFAQKIFKEAKIDVKEGRYLSLTQTQLPAVLQLDMHSQNSLLKLLRWVSQPSLVNRPPHQQT